MSRSFKYQGLILMKGHCFYRLSNTFHDNLTYIDGKNKHTAPLQQMPSEPQLSNW